MEIDPQLEKKMERRRHEFDRYRIENLKNRYMETGDKKYILMVNSQTRDNRDEGDVDQRDFIMDEPNFETNEIFN